MQVGNPCDDCWVTNYSLPYMTKICRYTQPLNYSYNNIQNFTVHYEPNLYVWKMFIKSECICLWQLCSLVCSTPNSGINICPWDLSWFLETYTATWIALPCLDSEGAAWICLNLMYHVSLTPMAGVPSSEWRLRQRRCGWGRR